MVREKLKNQSKSIEFRCFINKHNEIKYPQILKLIKILQSKPVYQYIGDLLNKNLIDSYVRVEIVCDSNGFWLKKHCDIKEKLMSCIIYMNQYNTENENIGTAMYNKNLEKVYTVPFKHNFGFFFYYT